MKCFLTFLTFSGKLSLYSKYTKGHSLTQLTKIYVHHTLSLFDEVLLLKPIPEPSVLLLRKTIS